MKKEKTILKKVCEYDKCKKEFETTIEKKRFCCYKCQQSAKFIKQKINPEDYIKLETFVFMIKESMKEVLNYLKDHEEVYYTKFNDWFVNEDLFKIFKPIKTVHEL